MDKGFIKVYAKHKKVMRVVNKIEKLRIKRDRLEDEFITVLIKYYGEVGEDDPTGIELAMDMGEKITEEQYNDYVKYIESR